MTWVTGVTVAEEHGTRRETATETGVEATVRLRCAWSDRWTAVHELLGSRKQYPDLVGWGDETPIARSAVIEPALGTYSASGDTITAYAEALITVNFSTKVEDLIAESLEPTAEFITLDYKRFRWGAANGDPLLEAEAPGKLIRGLNIVRTVYQLSSLPAAILTSVGCVNQAQYVSALLGLTFAAETLLFQPPTTSRTVTTDGTKGWNLTMKFQYKPDTWNKFWRGKTGQYEEIFDVAGGAAYKNYPTADFSSLLA